MPAAAQQTFFLDEFAHKQFNDVNPDYSGTRIYFDSADFVARIQQYHDDGRELIGGYAPFCKHIFVPNFTGARLGSLAITQENRHLLRSAYSRRRPEELPVLSRHAPTLTAETCRLIVRPNRLTAPSQDVQPVPEAKFLNCILYSRDQLMKEYEAMPEKGDPADLPEAQDEDYETPMQPITIMRNSLGKAEGGSGVPLDKDTYEESAAFWDTHAAILVGQKPSGE
ncbi:TPA: hypothetical protein ACH3X3_009951 [Trebouxia sp. C0006]